MKKVSLVRRCSSDSKLEFWGSSGPRSEVGLEPLGFVLDSSDETGGFSGFLQPFLFGNPRRVAKAAAAPMEIWKII